ncbi:MAG: cytochrome C oxidase subunit IV family protein [Thermaerobacter sp.]|nr:cytochrome C oxidase subunit IV family protein [Thermaerobacter sp.]
MSTHAPIETLAQPQASHTPLYVGIGAAMLILTLAAVFLVEIHVQSAILLPILAVMAVIQVVLQAFLYMHLRGSRRAYTLFFVAGASIALLFATCLAILIQQWA